MRVALITLLLLALSSFANADAEQSFEKGILLFRNGRVNEALEEFKNLEKVGYKSALMDYNIGVTAHRVGKRGLATAKLLSAAARYPLDRSITDKLAEVRKVSHAFNPPLSLTISIDRIRMLTLLSLGLVSVGIVLRKAPLVGLGMAGTLLFIPVLGVAEMTKERLGLNGPKLVGQVDKLPIFIAKDNQTQVVELGNDGQELNVLKVDGDWIQVGLPSGRIGWVKKGPEVEIFQGSSS